MPPTSTTSDLEERARVFYDQRRSENYGDAYTNLPLEARSDREELKEFIKKYGLADKRCLEIGSSGGGNQDLVADYWGTDIAESLATRYHKQYRVANGARYPFDDEMFDAIWTVAVFEHIPDLQTALAELVRMLRPGGLVYFAPAWQCRPWAAEGYQVRPYAELGIRGKLIKASIPIRDSVAYRSMFIFPKRAYRHFAYLLGRRYEHIRYKKLKANWEVFWVSDSDACNSMDPHDAILWFESHGLECLSHPMHVRAFLVRSGAIILRKRGRSDLR